MPKKEREVKKNKRKTQGKTQKRITKKNQPPNSKIRAQKKIKK